MDYGKILDEGKERINKDREIRENKKLWLPYSALIGFALLCSTALAVTKWWDTPTTIKGLYVLTGAIGSLLLLCLACVEGTLRRIRYGNLMILARMGSKLAFRNLKEEFGEDYGVE